jgi:hypothetical protein
MDTLLLNVGGAALPVIRVSMKCFLEEKTTGGKDNVEADGEEILKETFQRRKRLACCQSVSSQS